MSLDWSPRPALLHIFLLVLVAMAGGALGLKTRQSNKHSPNVHKKHSSAATSPLTPKRKDVITSDPANNIGDYIYDKLGANLHLQKNHPIGIIKQAIYDYFEAKQPAGKQPVKFTKFDGFSPVVSTIANFDEMLAPSNDTTRSPNNTFYVSSSQILRTHTSAHQAEALRSGLRGFLITGDVYRRDSIDATHYPVFHQMEGVRVFSKDELTALGGMDTTELLSQEVKVDLVDLAKHLFGNNVEYRWVDTTFPQYEGTSYELEIFFNGKWLEVLACGVVHQSILDKNYKPGHRAWGFGLGLDRMAMVLFNVPDIRLLWSKDDRFLKQFKAGDLKARFKPYSNVFMHYKQGCEY